MMQRGVAMPRLAALGVVALLASAVTACGIPDHTDVRVDSRGPVSDTVPADRPGAAAPPDRLASTEPEQFVLNFLTAAAGEPGEVYERVNGYILADRPLEPKQGNEGDINIVRLRSDPLETLNNDGIWTVRIDVQQVGVLRTNGSIDEPVETESSYVFRVGAAPPDPGAGKGLWLLEPPQALLMTDTALSRYYQEHSVYFWSKNGDALVPDLRYLPKTVPVQRQATEVLNWLVGGPSDWLSTTAERLPDGTSRVGNVPAPKEEGDPLEVSLSVRAGDLEDPVDLKKLFTQIAWSLRTNPLLDNELELKIQNQSRMIEVAHDYLRNNELYQLDGNPDRYGVLAGRLYPLVDNGQADAVPIAPEANRDIVSAGMSRDGGWISAALVTRSGNSFQLRVGAGQDVVRDLRPVGGTYAEMGRPVWLKKAGDGDPTGLVVADGRLWEFGTTDGRLREVSLSGAPNRITAVGAALDGSRIAFVAGGGVFVAAVRPLDGKLTVGPARRLATSLDQLSGVDWFGENALVVAGSANDRPAIYRISTDGTGETPQVNDVGAAVSHLVGYPDDRDLQLAAPLLYEANEVAYAAGTPITREAIPPGAETPPAGTAKPLAPFYLY